MLAQSGYYLQCTIQILSVSRDKNHCLFVGPHKSYNFVFKIVFSHFFHSFFFFKTEERNKVRFNRAMKVLLFLLSQKKLYILSLNSGETMTVTRKDDNSSFFKTLLQLLC